MSELRGELRLSPERPDRAIVARNRWMERLQRDLSLEGQVTRAPHRSERAASERRKNFIVVPYRPAHASFGRLPRRSVRLATHHYHAARWITSIDCAEEHGERREAVLGIDGKSAVERAGDNGGSLRPEPLHG